MKASLEIRFFYSRVSYLLMLSGSKCYAHEMSIEKNLLYRDILLHFVYEVRSQGLKGILFLLFSLLGNMFYGRFGIILSLFIFLFMFIRALSFKRFFREIVITGTIIIMFYISLKFINNPVLDAWKLWLSRYTPSRKSLMKQPPGSISSRELCGMAVFLPLS